MYSDPPLRYRPAPVSVIVKRAKSRIAHREFAEFLDFDPELAIELANDALDEASRQEEDRQNILEGSL